MSDKEGMGLLESEEGLPFYAYYGAQFSVFSQVVAPFHSPSNIREHVVVVLSQAIVKSSNTLLFTADKLAYRDCAVVARTIFETLVNILYLLASDDNVAQSMVDHANMKLARDLDRTVESGTVSFKIQHAMKDEIINDPEIQEVWRKFSTSKGKEKRSWTEASIEKRIQVIESAFGSKIALALVFPFENYRFASEVIHGTLYGVLYSRNITLTDRPSSLVEHDEYARNSVLKLLLSLAVALGEAGRAIANDALSDEINRKVSENNEKYRPMFKDFIKQAEIQDNNP